MKALDEYILMVVLKLLLSRVHFFLQVLCLNGEMCQYNSLVIVSKKVEVLVFCLL